MRIPVSTYRVQFNQGFRFSDATALVLHLDRLGISHLYASPILAARPGSAHGYDVVDPNCLNPELGSQQDFEALVNALHERGMGLLLDIVPNHMAASPENAWWMDVLENGPASQYASYFGINWSSARDPLNEKIFLPILGDTYGRVLDRGELRLSYEEGSFFLNYYAHKLPIAPDSYAEILDASANETLAAIGEFGALMESLQRLPSATSSAWDVTEQRTRETAALKLKLHNLVLEYSQLREHIDRRLIEFNESVELLDTLIQKQPYRIAFWRVATERINYRRFFDISDLIGMRVEDPAVFEAGHKLVLELVSSGKADGFRIDHIDGLADPLGYQRRLPTDVYVVVEKILVGDEKLPDEWPVQGTTGYDFLGHLNSLFVEPSGLEKLDHLCRTITGSDESFEDVAYERKTRVIGMLFSGEMQDLGAHLAVLAEADRNARDLSTRDITKTIIEVTACMGVYRTYIDSLEPNERDIARILEASEKARRRNPAIDPQVFDFVERVLTLRFKKWMTEQARINWLEFTRRWQQLSGPIMAKGVEDSAMYVYNRLISMNDVGGLHTPVSAEQMHGFLSQRQLRWPHTMNATSTHDTKRSEDVRARINVLSEIPGEWARSVVRWSRWLADRRLDVDLNEEYFLFQTLLGAWPLQTKEVDEFRRRMKEYVVKAIREARTYTSWMHPNVEHESALQAYVDVLFDDQKFQMNFQQFCERTSFYGAINSLSQLLLKVTAPGVPDFYRGTIDWDFSLVDPDNRRPAEFAPLTDFRWKPRDLLDNWHDGRLKVFLTEKLLGFRKGNRELFETGDYLPIEATGKRAQNVFAYARRSRQRLAIAVVPRFATQLSVTTRAPLGIRAWLDSTLVLPQDFPSRWKNVITGQNLVVRDGLIQMSRVLEQFPVALLSSR
ncbi:MAG TPA: malto-oligosyltrehalose synthase [Bryobacteraceae bacterium]|nr:malto-oligosyltrehalose synthase [Bryobacteraceae bacterium]